MKRSLQFSALAAILATGTPGAVSASFVGTYDVSKWELTDTASGAVGTSNAPSSISLTSGNNQVAGYTDFTITAFDAGTLSFAWTYATNDIYEDPVFDPFGYLLNGAYIVLAGNDFSEDQLQAGSIALKINRGDVFGFRAETFDGWYGSSVATVSDFNFAVPEPASLALFGIGLVGVATRRHRRGPQTARVALV